MNKMDIKKRYLGMCVMLKAPRQAISPLLMPALPAIALTLSIPSARAKHIIVMISVGLMLSRLFLSFFGDRFLIKSLLLAMMPLSVLGSLLGFIPSINAVLLGTVLIGMSYGGASTLVPAMLHEGNPETITESVGLVSALAPWLSIVALLGSGYVVEYMHWQYLFYILLIFNGVMLLSVIFSKLPKVAINNSQRDALTNLLHIITNKKFILYIGIFSIIAAGMLLFVIIMPFLIIKHMYISAHAYAWIALPSYIMNILAGFLCVELCNKVSQRTYYFIALACFILCLVMLYLGAVYPADLCIVAVLSMSFYSMAVGLIADYTYSRIVMLFPKAINAATAVLGIACNIMAIIFGVIGSRIGDRTTLPMGIFLSGVFILVVALLLLLKPLKQTAAKSV